MKITNKTRFLQNTSSLSYVSLVYGIIRVAERFAFRNIRAIIAPSQRALPGIFATLYARVVGGKVAEDAVACTRDAMQDISAGASAREEMMTNDVRVE